MHTPRFYLGFAVSLFLAGALAGCVSGVNGSVDVAPGTSTGDASTVNGVVRIGTNAKAAKASTVNGAIDLAAGASVGDASTVNGHITLAEHASAGSISTVNGGVSLAAGATVTGSVSAVNGAFDLAAGSSVAGSLTNVNSHITINGAHVGRGIRTINGDIDISGNAVIDGGIKIEQARGVGITFNAHVPRIVIGAGATVNGPLVFDRKVALYINTAAHVAGPITGATAVQFSGPTPPAS